MVEKTKRGGKKGDGTGKEESTGDDPDVGPIEGGPMHQKGANIAKKLMSLLSIKDYQAAGIVGNLIQESALVSDRIQGKPPSQGGPLKVDGVTGYSYPQWTSIDRQRNFAKYMESKGFDWKTKGATDEMATGFLVKEFKQAMSSRFTNTKNAAEASNWVLFNYERPADQGTREQKERAHDAQKVLSKMSEGGVVPFRMSGGNVKVDTGFHRRERSQVVETGLYRAKTLKEKKYKQYAAGGVHRTIPDTSSTSWAAGIPLTYVRSKEGKTAEVAVPLAKRFQGFITDLQSTGYKISELGGFRPDGPPAGNADGKGPQYAHPYGAAIDINWTKNPAFRKVGNDFPPNVKQIANKWGLGWGNAFDDAMHFSAMKREYGSGIDGQEISKKSLMGAKGGDYVPSSQDESPPTDSPASDKQTEEKVDSGFMGSGASIDQLKYLMANLGMTGGGGSGSAPTTPSAPPASSALPSMSSNFTLDKKMSAITSKISETVIVQQGSNNFSNISVSSLPLNTFISTTDVLNKL